MTSRVKLADSPLRRQFKKSPKNKNSPNRNWTKKHREDKIRLQNSVCKVIMMNLNNFQGEQLWKTIWKILKTFVISPTKIILPGVTGYIFQHTLISFNHTNAMNPFSKLTNGEKVRHSRYKLLNFLRKIVRRHANFSASDLFHPDQNGKIFQHKLIYCIHTNAMNPFSKFTNGEKVMHSRYNLLILFVKSCASPCKLFSVIFIPSGSEREGFSTQTDRFYSYQCNEPIFKVDKWGKSYVKLLQTFNTFCEKLCAAMATFQRHIYSIRLGTERFFNTNWFILFIPMQWTHFQSWQMGKSHA